MSNVQHVPPEIKAKVIEVLARMVAEQIRREIRDGSITEVPDVQPKRVQRSKRAVSGVLSDVPAAGVGQEAQRPGSGATRSRAARKAREAPKRVS